MGWCGWGSLRDLSKNILKQGVGKDKSCWKGGGRFEGFTTPAPRKILIVHQPGHGLTKIAHILLEMKTTNTIVSNEWPYQIGHTKYQVIPASLQEWIIVPLT